MNGDDVDVYKYEEHKFDKPILTFKPNVVFIGKSKVCDLTENCGTDDSSFEDNTVLLEFENRKQLNISGSEFFKFETDDKIIDYISVMSNNMIPYTNIIGKTYTYYIALHYKFIENGKTKERFLLNTSIDNLDPYGYHKEKCPIDSFKKVESSLIQTCWLGVGEDDEDEDDEDEDDEDQDENDEDLIETQYLNGNNEVVRIFNQKCVICLERDSIYEFRQSGQLFVSNVIKMKTILT